MLNRLTVGDIVLYYAPAVSTISYDQWVEKPKFIGVVKSIQFNELECDVAFATEGSLYSKSMLCSARALIRLAHVSDFGLEL